MKTWKNQLTFEGKRRTNPEKLHYLNLITLLFCIRLRLYLICSTTFSAIQESNPDVGSSQRRRGVSAKTSEANANRRISPPEMPLTRPRTPISTSAHFVSPNWNSKIAWFLIIWMTRLWFQTYFVHNRFHSDTFVLLTYLATNS